MCHVEGFYSGYIAVFDKKGRELKSAVQELHADTGEYSILKGKKLSYFLFVGTRTYQGWTNWYIDLWKAGTKWTRKWTFEEPGVKGESPPAEISADGLKVYEMIIEQNNTGSIIPDWRLEYSFDLIWDGKTEKFIKKEP